MGSVVVEVGEVQLGCIRIRIQFAEISRLTETVLGARIGSSIVIRQGTRFIRPIFISVVLALTLKLLFDAFGKG